MSILVFWCYLVLLMDMTKASCKECGGVGDMDGTTMGDYSCILLTASFSMVVLLLLLLVVAVGHKNTIHHHCIGSQNCSWK